jgi:hypothetical protein
VLTWLKKVWNWFIGLFKSKKNVAVKLQFNRLDKNGNIIERNITMAIITSIQQLPLAVQPLDAKNQPAQIDGVPVWTCSDPAKANLVVADDGLSCVLKGLVNGTVQIIVSAKNLLGVVLTSDPLVVEVVSGIAVKIVIIAGTPVEQV